MTVDYWAGRAVPILIAIRDTDDQTIRNGILYFHRRDEDPLGLGLNGVAVHQTLLQLRDARYVDFDVEYAMPDGVAMTHFELTGRGMQVLGEWPRFETLTSPATLGTIIESLAGYADPQEAPQMRKAAKTIRGIGASLFFMRSYIANLGHAVGLAFGNLRIALSDRVSWNDDGQHSEGIAYDVSVDLGYRVIDHEGRFQYLPLATARNGNVSIDETDPDSWACDAVQASELMGASDYWAPRMHASTRGLILK